MMITHTPSPPPRRNSQTPMGGSFIHSHGTKVFVPHRIDHVQDAVNQARFSERRWVWVQDEEYAYIRAHILNENGNKVEVELENGMSCFVPSDKVYAMNPPKFDRVEDMAELTHLNEPSVIHNLTLRYHAGEIYTYSGLFLVAVNPYRKLGIYSQEYIQSYKGRRRGELSPHIYAVADQAYHDMVQDHEDQSILITGESGAGKTENTKIVIQYLAAVANSVKSNQATQLAQQILQANPILEAFGNAQTIRNNNSSRFGKFIRIKFNARAQISGANIEWYLLEKSRVHQQSIKERNYHIFYQLLNADQELKDQLWLTQPADFNFTKRSKFTIEGVDDAVEFQNLMNAFEIMGLSKDEVHNFLRIVAAVLHLGNINVTPDSRGDRADVRDLKSIERVCDLLGIPSNEFRSSLLMPRIKAGRDWVTQAKSYTQVCASLDAIAKALYERNFASLVERVNQALDGNKSSQKTRFIGVLDIAGFEIFEINSFEQLCINYTNEKLQQFFNHSMFELEQQEYKKQKIEWSYIDFGLDLQPTIDLIEKSKPRGILSCLEEECVLPKGSDKRFLEKLNEVWAGNSDQQSNGSTKYKPVRFKEGFVVKHYAGNVEYSTNGWIDKNKDPLNEDITRLLARSTVSHVASLFDEYLTDNEMIPGTPTSLDTPTKDTLLKLRKGTGSFQTVGQRHKQQLLSLMRTLDETHPHFVRCMLPNNRKRSGEIQPKLVLDQLRCNGVLEGIRICRKGFPNRLSFDEFRKRYELLCPNLKMDGHTYGRAACQALLEAMQVDPERYRLGTSKVFFKATVLAELEEIRDRYVSNYMTNFQAMCRRYVARQRITRKARQTEAIKVMQRNARIYVTLREWPWWKLYAKLRSVGAAYRTETQIRERDQKITQQKAQLDEQQTRIEQLQQQITQQQTEHADRTQGMEQEFKESKQALLDKLAGAEERMDAMNQALESSQQENEAQAAMIMRLHKDIRECNDDNESLAKQCQSLRSTNETLSARVEYLENDTAREHDATIERLKQEIAQLQAERDQANQCLKEKETECNQLQEERDQANEQLKETSSQLEESKRRGQELEEQIQQMQSNNDSLQANWKDLALVLKAEASEAKARSNRLEEMVSKFALS